MELITKKDGRLDIKAYEIKYKSYITYLNPNLLMLRKINKQDFETLKHLHRQQFEVYELMENTDDVQKLKELNKLTTKIQYEMQKAWHFRKNKNRHYWYNVPKCDCPKLDNQERLGTPFRIINQSCIIHGTTK